MVKIFTNDTGQIDFLTYLLDAIEVEYKIEPKSSKTVCMSVDGVPLDYERAIKWALERIEDEH